MLGAYLDAFKEPNRCMHRLYGLAQRQRWGEDTLPWSTLELDGLPEPIRAGAADLFTQVLYGELAAMCCAARLVQELQDLDGKLVCATQVADEAKHVRWFAILLHRLDRPGRVRDVVTTLMHEVYEAPTLEQLVAGMQILVEGMAHSLFAEGRALLEDVPGGGPVEALRTVVGDWLATTVAADEQRHVAFGTAYLRRRVPALSEARRDALEAALRRWGDLLAETAAEPDLFTDYGLPWNRFAVRCVADYNARLQQCRLRYRLPGLET